MGIQIKIEVGVSIARLTKLLELMFNCRSVIELVFLTYEFVT